ncbi:MAG: isoprenylcysteine carboxylmethyltransferase family protein [Methanobacterium formicicum]
MVIKIVENKDIAIFSLFILALAYSYFLLGYDQTLLYLFLVIFLVYSFISLHVSRKYGAQIKGWPSILKEKDYTSIALTVPQTGLMMAVLITFYTGIYSTIIVLIGFSVMFVGMGFNLMVRRELGKNWVPLSKTTENQELVTTGIYSRVRHPFYLSILVLFLGVAIISQNLWGLIFFILFIAGLIIRMKKEEKELILKFGEEYIEYINKTPRLFPRV